jgi:cytochrome c553
MSHKDVNPHILFPFLISCAAAFIISFAFDNVKHRGHNPQSACINECYERLLERREVARVAKIEEERLIAAGVIEAPVVVEDLTPPMWNGCAGCHGTKGEGMGMFPKIAGQSKEYITTALLEYKNRKERGRQSMIMWSQASFLSDRDIDTLGDFISNLEN